MNQHSEKLFNNQVFHRVYFTLGFCLVRFQFTVRGDFKILTKFLILYFNSPFNLYVYEFTLIIDYEVSFNINYLGATFRISFRKLSSRNLYNGFKVFIKKFAQWFRIGCCFL